MKKYVFMTAILMSGYMAKAQGFYGELNVGYGFGFPGQVQNDGSGLGTITEGVINVNALTQERETVLSTNKTINKSVGAGLNLQLTPGYMFNDHIGVELGINYYMGSNVDVLDANRSMNLYANHPLLGELAPIQEADWAVITASTKSSQLRLIPTLVLSTGASNKISGYAKFGLVLPVAGASVVTFEDNTKEFINPSADIASMSLVHDGINTNTTYSEQKIKAGFTVGFKGAMGINFQVADKIGIFAEAFFTSLQLTRKTAEYTTFEYNGVDQLSNMSTFAKNIEYVNELSAESNTFGYGGTVDPSKAQEVSKTTSNFNQLGLAVGVKFNF